MPPEGIVVELPSEAPTIVVLTQVLEVLNEPAFELTVIAEI